MNTNTPITLESIPVLSWDAPTHPSYERSKRWYIVAGILVFIAASYGIATASWSFAIVCVLAGGMYVLIHDHKHANTHIELHDSGVLLSGSFTRWDELTGFWILHTPTYSELRFIQRRPRMRMIIQTGTQDLAQLRMILGQRLPELTQMKESILDILFRLCKL